MLWQNTLASNLAAIYGGRSTINEVLYSQADSFQDTARGGYNLYTIRRYSVKKRGVIMRRALYNLF
jgi:hypothetical protein